MGRWRSSCFPSVVDHIFFTFPMHNTVTPISSIIHKSIDDEFRPRPQTSMDVDPMTRNEWVDTVPGARLSPLASPNWLLRLELVFSGRSRDSPIAPCAAVPLDSSRILARPGTNSDQICRLCVDTVGCHDSGCLPQAIRG